MREYFRTLLIPSPKSLGVRSVRFNPYTGSLLVHYTEDTIIDLSALASSTSAVGLSIERTEAEYTRGSELLTRDPSERSPNWRERYRNPKWFRSLHQGQYSQSGGPESVASDQCHIDRQSDLTAFLPGPYFFVAQPDNFRIQLVHCIASRDDE